MRDAYLVGAGQSDFGAFPDESYRSLFRTAFEAAPGNVPAGLDPDDEAVDWRLYTQEGVPRYGTKVRPVGAGEAGR